MTTLRAVTIYPKDYQDFSGVVAWWLEYGELILVRGENLARERVRLPKKYVGVYEVK